MITTEVMGGLGNQLFQIFNLISYCLDHSNIFVLEKHESLRGPIRKYNVYWDSIFRNIDKHCKKSKLNFPVIRENGFTFTKIPEIPLNKHVKFFGYFQSYKYFQHNFEKINDLLDFPSQKKEVIENNPLDYENMISIHFRIGDYAQLQDYHPLITCEYYIRSIDYIIQKSNRTDWKFLIFCEKDDLHIVNSSLSIIKQKHPEINFIICNHELKDWQQMFQMSSCKHNIIANSSFSWWAAYLNSEKEKIVCYPNVWFGKKVNNNTKDLLPHDWIEIDV